MASPSLSPSPSGMNEQDASAKMFVRGRPRASSADVSSLQWLNVIIGSFWPHAKSAIQGIVEEQIIPEIQKQPGCSDLQFAKFDLGSTAPKFGPIQVHKTTFVSGKERIHIQLTVDYDSDIDVLLDSGYQATIGIKGIKFNGTINIVLGPLLDVLPIVAVAQVFFSSKPELSFEFDGLLASGSGTLESIIIRLTEKMIRNKMVLPNRILTPVSLDKTLFDLTEACASPPKGVLRVKATKASNIAGANWKWSESVDGFTSNPFPVYRVGGSVPVLGRAVPDTCHPKWHELPAADNVSTDPASCGFFLVHQMAQSFVVAVKNAQKTMLGGKAAVSFLGDTAQIPLADLPEHWNQNGEGKYKQTIVMDTKRVNTDMLHANDPVATGAKPSLIEVEADWLRLCKVRPQSHAPNSLHVCVVIKVHEARNVSQKITEDGLYLEACLKTASSSRLPLEPHQEGYDPRTRRTTKAFLELDEEELEYLKQKDRGGIYGKVAYIVDRLVERKIPAREIAEIIGSNQKDVEKYISFKIEQDAKKTKMELSPLATALETQKQNREARWNQQLALFLPEADLGASDLWLNLVGPKKTDAFGQIVFSMGTVKQSGGIKRNKFTLKPVAEATKRAARGSPASFLSSFFGVAQANCSAAIGSPNSTKYPTMKVVPETIELDIEVEMHYLVPAAIPTTDYDEDSIVEEPMPRQPSISLQPRVSYEDQGGGRASTSSVPNEDDPDRDLSGTTATVVGASNGPIGGADGYGATWVASGKR